jgi:hypothetical protein
MEYMKEKFRGKFFTYMENCYILIIVRLLLYGDKLMIKLTNILTEDINEYSDEEKQRMGIPLGAIARGGQWFSDDKSDTPIGKVVNGKFVRTAQPAAPKITGTKSPPKGLPDDAFNIGSAGGGDTWFDRTGQLLGTSDTGGNFKPADDIAKQKWAAKMAAGSKRKWDEPFDSPQSDDEKAARDKTKIYPAPF